MILSKAYDVEILPNFFSITIIDVTDYLKVFNDACVITHKKGKELRTPIPLIQKYTVAEIKEKLNSVKKDKFYITDKDDSQLLPMLGTLNNMRSHYDINSNAIRTDMFGYNSNRYDKLMIAALLMYSAQCNSTTELITRLYETSKKIIDLQNNPEIANKDYFLSNLRKYNIPYTDIDVMSIFALNKVGKGVDSNGNVIYFGKSLKQTSINLQWYELLEHEFPNISELDIDLYNKNIKYKGLNIDQVNALIDKWDRYIIDDWIEPTMYYNENDTFIVCEMIRLYIDEIRLRYNISKVYEVNVLSSSRSNIADKLFTKFYSEFSGLRPEQWRGKKTERTALSFKKVIFPFIEFKTKYLQDALNDMKSVVIHSVNKDAFKKEIKLGNLTYTIATGGLHSQDIPRELKSVIKSIDIPLRGNKMDVVVNSDWSNITDDSYIYVHFDISSFYPSIIVEYEISPAHMNTGIMVKLVKWLRDTRILAKHSIEDFIDKIPKDILSLVLKIVINSIYGKYGFDKGDLCDKLAVLKVTINGQLMIIMLCEELEMNNIEIVSANTDGIVVKLYKKDKKLFDQITNDWCKRTKLSADSEEYLYYVNRDINNYFVQELNGKFNSKGALNPKMYLADLQKGYDMPIVAQCVVDYFLYNKSIMDSLYDCKNILDFCKTQNIGRQYNIKYSGENGSIPMQRNIRFYVSNKGNSVFKINKNTGAKSNLCAGNKVIILNTLDDTRIEHRNICYNYYYNECIKIIDPIKLSVSPNKKSNRGKGLVSGKNTIKKYSGMYKTLFDDNEE